jgi:hypothetical protein
MSVLALLVDARTDTPTWADLDNLRTAIRQSQYLSTMANLPFSGILLVSVGIKPVTAAQVSSV